MQSEIVIIGAGISGLYAASQLKKFNYKVRVLEATDRIGGRIRSTQTLPGQSQPFSSFPLELGAEEVHGELSEHKQIVEKSGGRLTLRDQKHDFISLEGKATPFDEFRKKHPQEFYFIDSLCDLYYNAEDDVCEKDCLQFIRENNLKDFEHFYNFTLAHECGTSLDTLGVRVAQTFGNFTAGEDNFFLDQVSQQGVLERNFMPNINDDIELNKPIKTIIQKDNKVEIVLENEERVLCDKVIVTVPISQIQKERISFVPELSQEKKEAIQSIGFDQGGKIFLKFSEAIFPETMHQFVFESDICNALWKPTSTINHGDHIYVGLLAGSHSQKLASMTRDEQIHTLLQDLQPYFDKDLVPLFEDYYFQNWTQEPYFEGLYSFPTPQEKQNARAIYQQSIDDQIYFAGEACHPFIWSSMAGALESGELVVHEILHALRVIPEPKSFASLEKDFKFETQNYLSQC